MSVPKKRARRTYLPAAERRDQILDCALEAFAEGGYHATSIADVCSRAGIGRGTLYQYFADKRALLQALAERITAAGGGELLGARAAGGAARLQADP